MPEQIQDISGLWTRISSHECYIAHESYTRKHRIRVDVENTMELALEDKYKDVVLVPDMGYYRRDPNGQPIPWQMREHLRTPSRQLPVWEKEKFWTVYEHFRHDHFVHVSSTDNRLLAYTADDDKGARDIQTPIKPGRYLRMYFNGLLSPKKIAWLAAWQASGRRPDIEDDSAVLRFATTPDEIAWVYMHGPKSCMDGENFRKAEIHPCRAYGAGDLAIAHIIGGSNPDKVVCRAIVWPEKKVAGRVYPTPERWKEDGYKSWHEAVDVQDRLVHKLKMEGYTFVLEDDGATFNGARLLKIPYRDGWLMPFIDGDWSPKDEGEYFVLTDDDGDFPGDETVGFVGMDVYAICDRCEGPIVDASGCNEVATSWLRGTLQGFENWCDSCRMDHAFMCDGSESWCSSFDLEPIRVGDETMCQGWVDDNCFWSSYSGRYWVIGETQSVTMFNGDIWTQDEFDEHGFVCQVTGRNLSEDRCHAEYPDIANDLTDEQVQEYVNSLKPSPDKPVKKVPAKRKPRKKLIALCPEDTYEIIRQVADVIQNAMTTPTGRTRE